MPGSDVELTIDRDIQWAAQSAITEQVQKSEGRPRLRRSCRTPAPARSSPWPTRPASTPTTCRKADAGGAGQRRAVQDAYEPGSTSKLMSMAAVLEEGAATPLTHVTVPNRLHRGDRLFQDDIDHATWYLTLNGVLAKSSNIGTILATGQLGKTQAEANQVLYSYLRKFGIGSHTGLGFPGETQGILAKPQDWSTSQQYTIPFGQGLSLNAMQAASVYSTIANGGVRVEPTLVRGTKGPDGRFTPPPRPKKTRVVSPKTAKTLAAHAGVGGGRRGGHRHQGAHPRLPGRGQDGHGQPGGPGHRHATRATPRRSPASRPPTSPRITVYCAIQNPTRAATSAARSADPSSSRSWSSP